MTMSMDSITEKVQAQHSDDGFLVCSCNSMENVSNEIPTESEKPKKRRRSMNESNETKPAKKKNVKHQTKTEPNFALFDPMQRFSDLKQHALNISDQLPDELSDRLSVILGKKNFALEVDRKKLEITNGLVLRVIFPAEKVVQIECAEKLTTAAFDKFFKQFLGAKSMNELFVKYFKSLAKKDEKESSDSPQLSRDQLQIIAQWMKGVRADEPLKEISGIKILGLDIHTLRLKHPSIADTDLWLTDIIIDSYFHLISNRSERNRNLPRVHNMNADFFNKFDKSGYEAVQNWTKNVDIFMYEMILIPIHIPGHWSLAIINFKRKKILYYDSLPGERNNIKIIKLYNYVKEECRHKKLVHIDMSEWNIWNIHDIAKQENEYDCGVFTCMYAEPVSRNQELKFSQKDMGYFRQKMVYELYSGRLLN